MGEAVYQEENGIYQIDCSSAVWSADQIHNVYHAAGLFLSDADFAIETSEYILLVEYKNANIPNAVKPSAFNPFSEKKIYDVARKFYDSLHYLTLEGKNKPIKYIYIAEYPNAGITDRKMLRNCIAEKLPFKMQRDKSTKLIHDFDVLSISEWNSHPEYSAYPLSLISVLYTCFNIPSFPQPLFSQERPTAPPLRLPDVSVS